MLQPSASPRRHVSAGTPSLRFVVSMSSATTLLPKAGGGSRTLSFAATGQRATVTLQPPYLINFVSKTINIHLFHNWVRLFGKDVLEIPELKSNLIIGNLFILLKFNI